MATLDVLIQKAFDWLAKEDGYGFFTKVISGRAPEKRGNGLKFVESIVRKYHLKVYFYSNDGMRIINQGLHAGDTLQNSKGVLAIINF